MRRRAAVSGAGPWIVRRGNTGALGAFAGHESEHASRQHSDVRRRVHHPLEFPAGALSPQSVIRPLFTFQCKVLDNLGSLRSLSPMAISGPLRSPQRAPILIDARAPDPRRYI